MKRDAEEPVAGDGSICAVSITKRAKLEEPEAADGITRRSPELVAADGAGISTKLALNLEKPSKKEKVAEEKSKRSKKKRAEEKNKQHNKVEVVDDLSMEEKIMARLAELDKQRAEEKSKISNLEKRIEDVSISIEKIASKIKIEEQVAGDGIEVREMAYIKVMGEMPDNEAGVKKMPDNDAGVKKMPDNDAGVKKMPDNDAGVKRKKKVVRWRLSKKLLNYLRTKEVMGLLATDEAPRPLWANKMAGELFPENSKLKKREKSNSRKKSLLNSRRTENSMPTSCISTAPRDMLRSKRRSPMKRLMRRSPTKRMIWRMKRLVRRSPTKRMMWRQTVSLFVRSALASPRNHPRRRGQWRRARDPTRRRGLRGRTSSPTRWRWSMT